MAVARAPWPPKTLEAWRTAPPDIDGRCSHARSLWDPLEQFFQQQGYLLFILDNAQYDIPRTPHEIRKPDPYHVFIGEPEPSRFWCVRNKLCGAVRLSDGTHVVLQLLAINEDGQDEVEILKRLHEKPISTKFRNRAVPLLDLITFACETGNLVFGVFPLLCPGFNTPGPGNAIEAFETVRQMFEALAYLHANLVAHLDMSKLEFLLNYGGSDTGEFLARRKARDGRYGFLSEDFLPGNFLEYFDYQWMITDFNVSVMFDPMSTPEDRLVVGLCGGKVLCDLDSYPKVSIDVLGRVHTLIVFQYYSTGPEVWKEPNIGRPYCPFKHDVWQLSTLLENLYPNLASAYPGYEHILPKMSSANPEDRPNMTTVLHQFEEYLASLTQEDLGRITRSDLSPSDRLPEHIAAWDARRAEQNPW